MVDDTRPRAGSVGATKRPPRTMSPLAIGLLAIGLSTLGAASPAAAQGFGWFGNLFGGARPTQQPRFPGYGQQQDPSYQPRRAPRRRVETRGAREKDAAARDREPQPPPKTNASVFVDVFGDGLGQNLASGLDDALADRQDVAVVHKARGSSGLVATEPYDWPRIIDETLAKAPAKSEAVKAGAGAPEATKVDAETPARIDVGVMMIGSNDRQPIQEGSKVYAPGTPDWTAAYRKRVMAIDEAFHRKGVPLVWVGVPITRSDAVADDMAALNDIYREAAAKTGAVFVDTWEAFSDDDGDFSAMGPDIDGQTVRLRTADGIYFTKAGSRKLAHFVETHVRRALDGRTRPVALKGSGKGKPVTLKPDAGPIVSLGDPPSARDGRLAASATGAEQAHDALVEASIVKGQAQAAPAGRADDLRWPAAGQSGP